MCPISRPFNFVFILTQVSFTVFLQGLTKLLKLALILQSSFGVAGISGVYHPGPAPEQLP